MDWVHHVDVQKQVMLVIETKHAFYTSKWLPISDVDCPGWACAQRKTAPYEVHKILPVQTAQSTTYVFLFRYN